MARRQSKRYRESEKQVDKQKIHTVKEAIAVLKSFAKMKFDESVEVAFDLRIDAKKSDQLIRGTVVLPNGTGKKVRIVAFCKGDAEKEASAAGANHVGAEDLMKKVAEGWLDFDAVVATPEMMRELSRLGKILGPRGLMPSPKTGTVTKEIGQAINELRAGKVEFKTDKQGDIHVSVGKVSFEEDKLCENVLTLIKALKAARPVSVKGEFIKSMFMSTTMGPGLRVSS